MKAKNAIATLEELGSSQRGLVTTAQAQNYGVSRVTLGRLRDDGIVHPVRRGVYALPSSGQEPFQELRAAWLATNPGVLAEDRLSNPCDVVISHRSAASIHGLGTVLPTRHEFTSSKRHTSSHHDVRFHRSDLSADERIVIDGMLATSIERTVADICGPGLDFDHLADVVRDALANDRTDVRRLAYALTPAARRLQLPSPEALIKESLNRAGPPPSVINALPHLDLPALLSATHIVEEVA